MSRVVAGGVLAIWVDCAPGQEADFEAWYNHEHLPERMAVPGFRVGRRYEAIDGTPRYLTVYETDSASVLASGPYRARLNDPTPATRRIMAHAFRNTIRAVCTRSAPVQGTRGAVVLTVASQASGDAARLADHAENTRAAPRPIHTETWFCMENDGGSSSEQVLRGKDRSIGACLVREFLRDVDALRAAERARAALPGTQVGVYRLLCELRAGAGS